MLKRIALTAAIMSVAGMLSAQTPAASIPRAADGKPDLSGIWQTGGISLTGGPQGNVVGAPRGGGAPGAAPAGRGAAPGGAAAGGRGGAAAGGAQGGRGGGAGRGAAAQGPYAQLPTQPPMQPWAQQKSAAMTNVDDPTVHCFMPGVPRIVSMPMPFEIVQTPKQVVILYEAFRAFRIIPTDGRPPVGEALPSFMGESVGKWEGDTLVVDVKNFNGKIWGPGNMKVTSDALHVVERYTPNGNTISYEAMIEDPKVLTGPFVYRATMQRPADTRIMEYECMENNVDIPHLVGAGTPAPAPPK